MLVKIRLAYEVYISNEPISLFNPKYLRLIDEF